MNTADAAWPVEGVDPAVRALAEQGASKAGIPVGAWIERAILHKAAGPEPGTIERIDAEFRDSRARVDAAFRPVILTLQELALKLSEPAPPALARAESQQQRPRPQPPNRSLAPSIDTTEIPEPRPSLRQRRDGEPVAVPGGTRSSPDRAERDPLSVGAAVATEKRGRWAGPTVSILILCIAAGAWFSADFLGVGAYRGKVEQAALSRADAVWRTLDDAAAAVLAGSLQSTSE